MAKKKSQTNEVTEELAGHQLGFDFSQPGYISVAKITILQSIELRFYEGKRVILDWLQASPIDFARSLVSGIEAIGACQTSQEANRVKVFPGAFEDSEGAGHLSAEVGIASNATDGLVDLEGIQSACTYLLYGTFAEIEQINGPRPIDQLGIADARLKDTVETQISELISGKTKLAWTPFLITIGERTYQCSGRKQKLLSTASPETLGDVVSGSLKQIKVEKDRTITLNSAELGKIKVNCSSQAQIREIREFTGEATTIEIGVDITYEDDVATAYSYKKFLRAYSDELI